MFRATIAVLVLALAGCGGSEAAKQTTPPPHTQTPAQDKELKELLKRADAAVPKDTPDNQPAPPSSKGPIERITIVEPIDRTPPSAGSSPTPGADNVPPVTAAQAQTESMGDKADRMFAGRFNSLSSQKAAISSADASKTRACTGSRPPPEGSRPGSLSQQNSDTQECRDAISQWEQAKSTYRKSLDEIEIEAKRAGILPGTLREMYAKHGFNPY